MASVKEPSFFCEPFQVVTNPIHYAGLFADVRAETAIGETSHVYLNHPRSAETLKAFFPEARFVLTFRHPSDRAYSLYHHMRRYGYETAGSFERALAIEDRRYHSEWFQKHCGQYFYNFLYFRSGLFSKQINRYFSLFDPERLHILTLADLKSDPYKTLGRIFAFLHVASDFRPDLKVYNQGRTSRSAWLQHLLYQKTSRPFRLRQAARRLAENYNVAQVPPMKPETRRELGARYAADLERFYDLTGIRLDEPND